MNRAEAVATATLLLDDLNTGKAPPGVHQLLSALAEAAMPGITDQATAAAAEGEQLANRIGHALDYQQHHVMPAAIPDAIRLNFENTIIMFAAGQGSTCDCIPQPTRPRPLVIAAWSAPLVTCPEHSFLHNVNIHGTDEDRRCDRCGHIDTASWPGVLQIGPFTCSYGLCHACRQEQDVTL